MSEGEIKKQDFFTAIKNSHLWQSSKIKNKLNNIMEGNHSTSFDTDDKFHYVYDNECFLFIFDEKIELRCDRENVFSSHQTITFDIKSEDDIDAAYTKFKSMTMEAEED